MNENKRRLTAFVDTRDSDREFIDRCAIAAMQGLLSNANPDRIRGDSFDTAFHSYEIAEAMLVVCRKRNEMDDAK